MFNKKIKEVTEQLDANMMYVLHQVERIIHMEDEIDRLGSVCRRLESTFGRLESKVSKINAECGELADTLENKEEHILRIIRSKIQSVELLELDLISKIEEMEAAKEVELDRPQGAMEVVLPSEAQWPPEASELVVKTVFRAPDGSEWEHRVDVLSRAMAREIESTQVTVRAE